MWINGLLLAAALALMVVGTAVFVWATRIGQFDDVEEVKFTMLRAEEDELPFEGGASWGGNPR